MKIKLQCGQNPKIGYLNIDSRPELLSTNIKDDIDYAVGLYGNIDSIVQDTSCDEIIFGEPLNNLNPQGFINNLAHWKQKLKSNGILIVYLIDIDLVSGFLIEENQNANSFLFGPNNDFNAILDVWTVKDVLIKLGFKIITVENMSEVAIKVAAQKV